METLLEFLRGFITGIALGALLCAAFLVGAYLAEWKRGNYDA